MEFRILGHLEVEDDNGRPITLATRQAALLALLLLRRGEVVPAERLVEDLYGGHPPPTAVKSLQAHVSRLRKVLTDGRLVTRGSGYLLQTSPHEVDVDRFSHLYGEGRAALAGGDVKDADRLLGEALALWRGPALAEFAYEEFAQPAIARLEELRLSCLEELAEARLELGRHAELVGELERLVEENPLRERLRVQLMLALYRSGRQADALAAYQDGRRALLDELGIDPGRALQELERAILNQDPALDAPVAGGALPEAADTGSTFVGRARELAQLDALLQGVLRGTGRFAVISGEAGIGKSRLVEELMDRARRLGVRVVAGRSWEAGGAPAFWPWVQALRAYVRDTSGDTLRKQLGAGAADLVHLLPELRETLPGIPDGVSLDSEGARFRLFDSTAAFLRRAAEAQPLLITLEDVHAADQSSLLLMSFLAGQLGDARAAIVATYREPELTPDDSSWTAVADVLRRASARISLGGLGEPEVAAYIGHVANEQPSDAFVATITTETEGNPLFVGEIVRLLAMDGHLPEATDAAWRPTIPPTVSDVIDRRLERLTPACRRTLAVASVIGREFSLGVLETLVSVPRDELVERLDEAVSARLVARVPGSGDMRFTHALVRDALHDELPARDRRELHRQAADAIVRAAGSRTGTHLSELAHHYYLALPSVDPDVAVEWATKAGDHARAVLAFEEAARLYETALEALSARTEHAPQVERRLLLALGEAHTGAGNTPAAKDAFLRAAVVARESDSAEDLAAAALGYGGQHVWARAAGDQLVVALLEEALAAVADEELALRARLLARLAGALRDERDPRRRREIGELAVTTARRAGDTTALIQALLSLSVAQYGFEDHDRRVDVLHELRRLSLETRDKLAEWQAINAEMVLASAINDFDAVRTHARTLVERAEELRQPSALWFADSMSALMALHSGNLDLAETLTSRAYERGRQPHPTDARAAHVIQMYLLRREQGRAAEVRDDLAAIAAENPARPFLRCAHAALAVDIGDVAEARRVLEALAPNQFEVLPRDSEWPLAAAFLVEVCRGLGDVARAAVLYDTLAPLAERSSANPTEGTIGSIARSLGILAALIGRDDDAVAHLRRAIEIDTATGARPWAAYAQLELAEVLETGGVSEEAQVLRADAAATAEELGLLRLSERARPTR